MKLTAIPTVNIINILSNYTFVLFLDIQRQLKLLNLYSSIISKKIISLQFTMNNAS